MTQVRRRPNRSSSSFTLIRTFILACAIIVVALLLFQMDAFPRRRNNRPDPTARKKALYNPEQLHRQQKQESLILAERQQLQKQQEQQQQEEEQQLQQQQEQQQQLELLVDAKENPVLVEAKKDPNRRRRYRLGLAGLTGPTSVGVVVLETRPDWAPLGAQRFHELVEAGFYDENRFFRVIPDFIVQFGINGDPTIQAQWRGNPILDDPVVQTNSRGTLVFATSGPNTRSTQLFINTRKKGSAYLDKEGFAPFGEVISGMEYVDKINDEYREKPGQGKIQAQGNNYLQEEFPNLSYVVSLREISEDDPITAYK